MDTRKLDLNLLVTLEALLAERNVTKAAERLGLSQPAVSAQLARLRDVFGDELLVPAQRGMTPTAQALELEAGLHQTLDQARALVTHGGSFDPATAELTISIASADAVHYSVLMPFAIRLRSIAPGVRLALRGYDPQTLERQIEAGEIDLAIIRPQLAPPGLLSRRLQRGDFVVIARRNHPVVRRQIDLEQFVAMEHVIAEPGTVTFTAQTDEALAALGRKRKVVLSASSFMLAAEIVARSDLIAVVPMSVVQDRADRLQILKPPLDIAGFELALVWHRRNSAHAGQRWVRETLLASVPHPG